MRWSVVLTDVVGTHLPAKSRNQLPHAVSCAVPEDVTLCRTVFFPAVLLCASVFTEGKSTSTRLRILAIALFQPPAILMDHGHFQYNNIGLGLSVRPLQEQARASRPLESKYWSLTCQLLHAGNSCGFGGHGAPCARERPLHACGEPQAHVRVLCSSLLRPSPRPMYAAADHFTKGTAQHACTPAWSASGIFPLA